MKRLVLAASAFPFILLPCSLAAAAEYHVATDGDDAAAGSSAKPWKTIQKAAATLQPGDTVTVHAGVYRERIDPARGGSAASPITYQAADGEDVSIKGSERITDWVQDGAVWHAVIPSTTFGTFNPYSTAFSGDYLTSGSDYHLGEVFLEGTPYSEVLAVGDTQATPGTWNAAVGASDTTITANFGDKDPNDGIAEITTREYVFFPSKVGLGYITVKGFHLSQAATQWAPPNGATSTPQDGLIGSNFGMAWTIENNYISDGKTVCVSGGMPSSGHGQGINESGNHTIRHNTIERCGQAGIAGSHGLVASKILGNLIQDVHNTPNVHFEGFEVAGIKIHTAVDVLIEGNVIRRVGSAGVGVWLDWQAQGTRLTRNVLYDLNNNVMLLEANHGPTLIDNNILIGSGFADQSEATIMVHNLMSAGIGLGTSDSRTPNYFKPHTTESAGTAVHASADNKYFNNIFVGGGVQGVAVQPGFASDYNVLYQGTGKTSWGDEHSIVDDANVDLKTSSLANGVEVTFKPTSAPTDVAAPLITRDFIGEASLTKQGIENHDGTPITIDHDLLGTARDATHPTAGPLEELTTTTKVTVMAGSDLMGSGQVPSGGASSGGSKATGGGGTGNGAGSGTGNASGSGSGGKGTSKGGAKGSAGGTTSSSSSEGGSGEEVAEIGGESAAAAAAAAKSNDGGGCGCHIPVDEDAPVGSVLTLLGLGAALLRRRSPAARS